MKNEDHCRVLNGQTLEKRRDALSLILSNFLNFAKNPRAKGNRNCKLYVKVAKLNCY